MKYSLAFILFAVCLVKLQAAPSESSAYNPQEALAKVADLLSSLAKSLEDSTGLHSEFDKEKFLKAGKTLIDKLTEAQTKLKEAIDSNFKNLPAADEIKKKLEEAQKQISETLKNLNSPEVQKSADKLRETLYISSKKISESFYELGQKFGIAPPPSIQKTLNEIYEDAVKSSKVFQEKVQKIIEEAQAELKKKTKN